MTWLRGFSEAMTKRRLPMCFTLQATFVKNTQNLSVKVCTALMGAIVK
jgi:hypothetical protein